MAGVILSYHRIAGAPPDTFSLAVSPANFEEHMRIVAGACAAPAPAWW